MNSKTAKLISPERARALLECYGADARAWPEDERASASALIHHSAELRELQQQARSLDDVLKTTEDQFPLLKEPADPTLVARIVDNLPPQDRSGGGMTRSGSRYANKGFNHPRSFLSLAAAAAAVLVISMSIVNLHTLPVNRKQPAPVASELDDWMWEQVTGESLDDNEEPLTFMALLELDQP
jgi:hypothetical protein